jgi:2'-5' RNA ligase
MTDNQDYRIFVGAFPTGELAERIQAVREKYDPKTAAITPPHVTLAGTYWRSGQPTPENETATIELLKTLNGHIPAFSLRLGGVHVFQERHSPVIYLGLEVTPTILDARRTLLGVLGNDKHHDFHPHLTLAMRLEGAKAERMLSDLQDTEWANRHFDAPIQELRLMQRGPKDPAWREIASIDLAK